MEWNKARELARELALLMWYIMIMVGSLVGGIGLIVWIVWWVIIPDELSRKQAWREQWRSGAVAIVINDLRRIVPSLIANSTIFPDQHAKGSWVIVNQGGWQLSEEFKFVREDNRPKDISDIAYVVIIGDARKKERWLLEIYRWLIAGRDVRECVYYTIYLVDWRSKRLVGREELTGGKPNTFRSNWSWEENQDEARHTIMKWLFNRGDILEGSGSY